MNLKKLSTNNFVILFTTMIISTLAIVGLWINDIYTQSENELMYLKQNYIKTQQNMLKTEVDRAVENIKYIRDIEENRIEKRDIEMVQKELLNSIRRIRFGQDGYIFIYNNDGVNIMHPIKPTLEGKDLIGLKDPNGKLVIVDLIYASKNEINPYVKYLWHQPSSNKIVEKLGYAKNVAGWNWMVGSGIYMNSIDKVIKDKQKQLNQKVKEKIIQVIGLFILILLFVLYFLYKQSVKINNSFELFHNFLQHAHTKSSVINLNKIDFIEFKELAKDANDMIIRRGQIQKELDNKSKQILQQSRLAQMGEMINMIAHQWRQPLSAISATSGSINIKARLHNLNDETTIELSNKISQYTQHLSSTIDDFREFFKSNKEKRDTNFNELVQSVLNIVEVSIVNKNIKLIQNLNCSNTLHTYPNELKQVILNLIKNAEDVLLENKIVNPQITIETNNGTLSISDNGGGVPQNIIEKIFDPYFSTKTKKDGTGLGLYMSKTIVEENCGGTLKVINCENGAVFIIKLGINK